MERKIPEIEAKNILIEYTGFNNQILDWKKKLETTKKFALNKTQSLYILNHHNTVPKVARKYVNLDLGFAEKLMEQRRLHEIPEKIWIEKLLCESDKAYHIWGKVSDKDEFYAFWIPKTSIIPEEKKLNRVIDYSKYDNRPPLEHQKVAIEKLLANNRFILADDMGLMKTGSSIIASLESDAKKILIVCPASLKINWQREIEFYSNKRVLIVEGRKWGSTFNYYIINYDILKNFHTNEKNEENEDFQLILNEKFDLAIIDEAHMISNSTAQRTKLLNGILDTIPTVWLLTGTPITSRPINYYNLLKIVRSPLTLNWEGYVKRYCAGYRFMVEGRKVWNTSGASNLDELREKTKSLVLRRMKDEVIDLPEKIISPVYLELNSSFYQEEMDEFIRISKEERGEDSLSNISISLNRLMKVRQIIAIEKIPYTCELIDKTLEQGKKIIIFTNFTSTLDTLHEKYKKISVTLDGRMNKDKRQLSVDKFQNNDKIKLFISNIKAGGVGLTLTQGEVVIMNDLSFVPSDHTQAEDRAYRYGQKNSVLIYYPIFDNTIERIIYNILQRKKNIIDQIMGDGEYSESFTKELFKELF